LSNQSFKGDRYKGCLLILHRLVVTWLACTSRGASGTASYSAIHAESEGDRGVSGGEIAVIHLENSSGDK
jgi:hypothetical protein